MFFKLFPSLQCAEWESVYYPQMNRCETTSWSGGNTLNHNANRQMLAYPERSLSQSILKILTYTYEGFNKEEHEVSNSNLLFATSEQPNP